MCKVTVENFCYGCFGSWCFLEECEQKKQLGELISETHAIQVDKKTNRGRMQGGVCSGCSKKLRDGTFYRDLEPDQASEAAKEG